MEWEQRRSAGELAGNRTQDPRIKSALLYQLSYELTVSLYCYLTVPHVYTLPASRKQQGHPASGALEGHVLSRLRYVVADCGLDHIVGTFRAATGVCRTTIAGPDIALEVAVLN